VYTEEDGSVYFSCDWADSEDAKMSVATMLYRLVDGELIDEIIQNIKSQCVLEDREQDYEKIFSIYSSLKLLKTSVDEISKNDVVVNPLDATTF
jgi:hypothetical protein